MGGDGDTCVFEVMRQPHADFLTQGDLTQFMQFVLQHHPGLEFLQVWPPELHSRAAATLQLAHSPG